MKMFSFGGRLIIITSLFAGIGVLSDTIAAESEYSFKVHNNTRDKITKLLVSEDKRDWGYFDIGQGITAGDNMMLVWDASTNDESCDQYVKAVFADGSESMPAKFNFCEANLELEF